MSPDDPRHGTYAGYWQHRSSGDSPCFSCRVAASKYDAERRRLQAYGRWEPWVDAEAARAYVRHLLAEGMSIRSVAAAASVAPRKISHLLYGAGKRRPPVHIRPDYSAAILAITPQPNKVPGYRVARRLRALAALGHSTASLSERLGVTRSRVLQLLACDDEVVVLSTLERVCNLYDELSMTRPNPNTTSERQGCARIKNLAERNGWPPPLAWVDIDDPAEKPHSTDRDDSIDDVLVWRFIQGDVSLRPNRNERYEIVRRWQGSDNELERRTGWNVARMRRDMNTTEEVA